MIDWEKLKNEWSGSGWDAIWKDFIDNHVRLYVEKNNEEEKNFFIESKEKFGMLRVWRKKSKDIWDRYNDAFSDKWLWPDYFIELMVKKNLSKKRFETADELVLWLIENQKWLISLWKKLNYGK